MDSDLVLLNSLRDHWASDIDKHTSAIVENINSFNEDLESILRSISPTSSPKRESLLEAEGLLYLSVFEELLQCVEHHLSGADSLPLEPMEKLADLKFLFEKAAALERKMKPSWDKLEKKLVDHEAGRLPKQTLKPRIDLMSRPRSGMEQRDLGNEDLDSSEHHADTGLYKAPKAFAVPYTKDKASKHARDHENKSKELQKLRQSEFVKAITADLLPTPVEYGDGEDELDPQSKKLMRKYKAEIAFEREHGMKVNRKKGEEKKYRELKTKQGMLRVGAELTELSGFIDRLDKSG